MIYNYRDKQKVFSKGSGYRRFDRLEVKERKSYFYQKDANRLFVCFCVEQTIELRKLCGKRIAKTNQDMVEYRRKHDPYMEEIALSSLSGRNV